MVILPTHNTKCSATESSKGQKPQVKGRDKDPVLAKKNRIRDSVPQTIWYDDLCMQACIIGMFAMLMRILGLNKIYTNALTKSNFLNYHYSRRFLWWASMDKYNFNSNLNLPIYILYLPLKKLSIRPCLYNIFIPDVEGL